MKTPNLNIMKSKVDHHVDPMRYPKIQGRYEAQAKNAFNPGWVFESVVKTMVEIVKEKK